MSLHLVYVCDSLQISVVNVLVFESHFSLGYCDQFYSTTPFWGSVRPLESRCVLLVLPNTIPLVTTIWYRMVLDSKYHRIYGTIESMVPAQHIVAKYELWDSHEISICSISNTRIFIDLHLPRLTHLHDARHLSHVRCVSVWRCNRRSHLYLYQAQVCWRRPFVSWVFNQDSFKKTSRLMNLRILIMYCLKYNAALRDNSHFICGSD